MTLQKTLSYLALSLLFIWSACGENEPTSPPGGNTLNIRLESPVGAINPVIQTTGYSRYVSSQVFQTLSYLDAETIEVKPLLVNSIPSAVKVTEGNYKDNLAYTFELRDAAQWDNGTPVTAADVEFSLKLLLHPLLNTRVWRGYMDKLSGFEADPANPKKFTIYLREYYILGLESITQFPIYPEYNYDPGKLLRNVQLADLINTTKADQLAQTDKSLMDFAAAFNLPATGSDKTKISGSGPYKVAFVDAAQGVILARKKDWWGDKEAAKCPALVAYPDTINYKLAVAEDAALNLLQSGNLDIATNISPAKFQELQKDAAFSGKYNFQTFWMPAFNRVLINHRDPILADKRVRKAIAQAVNYDEIMADIQHGMATRTVGPINPNNPVYAKDIVPYAYNIEQAKTLLAEAGWKDSDNDGIADRMVNGKKTDLELKLMTTTGTPVTDQITASLQTSMAKAGIKLEMVAADLPTITQETTSGKYQLAATASAWHPGTIDFHQVYHSSNILPGDNRSGIANTELDQLIDKIRVTEDIKDRLPMYIRSQEILHEEIPEVFLYATLTRMIASNKVDVKMTALRPGYLENTIKQKK